MSIDKLNGKDSLKLLSKMTLNNNDGVVKDLIDNISNDLNVLDTLKNLFICNNSFDVTYYTLEDNMVCVDTTFHTTEEKINEIRRWLNEIK